MNNNNAHSSSNNMTQAPIDTNKLSIKQLDDLIKIEQAIVIKSLRDELSATHTHSFELSTKIFSLNAELVQKDEIISHKSHEISSLKEQLKIANNDSLKDDRIIIDYQALKIRTLKKELGVANSSLHKNDITISNFQGKTFSLADDLERVKKESDALIKLCTKRVYSLIDELETTKAQISVISAPLISSVEDATCPLLGLKKIQEMFNNASKTSNLCEQRIFEITKVCKAHETRASLEIESFRLKFNAALKAQQN